MTTVHAWYSSTAALVQGSTVYRKPDGSTVNVTRTSPARATLGSYRHEEAYVGEVICARDGGCVEGNRRVGGING